jgi:hypothetical protein
MPRIKQAIATSVKRRHNSQSIPPPLERHSRRGGAANSRLASRATRRATRTCGIPKTCFFLKIGPPRLDTYPFSPRERRQKSRQLPGCRLFRRPCIGASIAGASNVSASTASRCAPGRPDSGKSHDSGAEGAAAKESPASEGRMAMTDQASSRSKRSSQSQSKAAPRESESAAPSRSSPAERRQETLFIARQLYKHRPHWLTFQRELFGVGGVVPRLFPTDRARAAFEKSPECEEIHRMTADLQAHGPLEIEVEDREPLRIMTVPAACTRRCGPRRPTTGSA